MEVSIYALIDPLTHQPRYIGKTRRSLDTRLTSHLTEDRNIPKRNWIRSLRSQGLKPLIETIELSDNDSWVESERFWIACFKFMGADLFNRSIGGEGGIDRGDRYKPKSHYTITIKVPAAVKETLQECAKLERRSLSSYVLNAGLERVRGNRPC